MTLKDLKIPGFAAREAAEREIKLWEREHPDAWIEDVPAGSAGAEPASFTLCVRLSVVADVGNKPDQQTPGTSAPPPSKPEPIKEPLLGLIARAVSQYDWDRCEPPWLEKAATQMPLKELSRTLGTAPLNHEEVRVGAFGLRRQELVTVSDQATKRGAEEFLDRRFDRSTQTTSAR